MQVKENHTYLFVASVLEFGAWSAAAAAADDDDDNYYSSAAFEHDNDLFMAASGAKGDMAKPGTHPRYIPKRGEVLKRILRALFGLAQPDRTAGGKVRPYPMKGRKKGR